MSRQVAAILASLVFFSGLCDSANAESQYWESAGERISVMSGVSAKRCEEISFQVSRFEQFVRELLPLPAGTEFPPVTVYVLTDDDAAHVMPLYNDPAVR